MQLKVDLIVAVDPSAIRAATQATKTIPIVMITNQDPVAAGLVQSLARPGGNVTGITRLTRELSGKRLELLKEVLPSIRESEFYGSSQRHSGQEQLLKTIRRPRMR